MGLAQITKDYLRSILRKTSVANDVINNLEYGLIPQEAPAAKTGAATITVADILGGIVTISHAGGATVALTLDTGSAMDDGMPGGMGTDEAIDWTIINTSAAAADTATLTASTGHTIVGTAIIQSAHSTTGLLYGNAVRFRSRRTAADTWVTYRLAG